MIPTLLFSLCYPHISYFSLSYLILIYTHSLTGTPQLTAHKPTLLYLPPLPSTHLSSLRLFFVNILVSHERPKCVSVSSYSCSPDLSFYQSHNYYSLVIIINIPMSYHYVIFSRKVCRNGVYGMSKLSFDNYPEGLRSRTFIQV